MKDSKSRGGSPSGRFEREVLALMRQGMSKIRAEQIVQQRAEDALKQGWGMGPGVGRRSEGNKTGGGGRSAAPTAVERAKTKKK